MTARPLPGTFFDLEDETAMPRLPASNRMHGDSALQTHAIWAQTIAPTTTAAPTSVADSLPIPPNPSFSALARLTGNSTPQARGSCRKCNGVGHLTFQCRNILPKPRDEVDVSSTSSDSDDSDVDSESDARSPIRNGSEGGRIQSNKDKDDVGTQRDRRRDNHKRSFRDEDSDRDLSVSPESSSNSEEDGRRLKRKREKKKEKKDNKKEKKKEKKKERKKDKKKKERKKEKRHKRRRHT